VLLEEIGAFENIHVEFVSGATPTAHLFDEDGNDIDSFVIGDMKLDGVQKLLEQHGFKLELKNKISHEAQPISVTEVGSVYYELYSKSVSHQVAKEFAEQKNRGGPGRLLTYNCSFQEAHIRKWLSKFSVSSIWLGGERNHARRFAWAAGPLSGVEFQANTSQYSNWVEGEPNDAGGNEGCVVQNLRDKSGWNDVNCVTHGAHIVVEYGITVVPCPIIPESEMKHEQYDPNFPVFQIGDEVNL